MRLYDGVSFGIQRHDVNVRPVSRVARPSQRVAFAGPQIEFMPGGQNRPILTAMTLRGRDVANAAMAVIHVVPLDKGCRPGSCLIE